jgi:predicted small secreted protein
MTPQKIIGLVAIKVLVLAAAIGVVFMMVGCNTMRGIGEDVEKAGEAIQRSTR